jgi:anti-sigma factor RsiW
MNHAQAWELIPWFVNGTASAEQCERVEQHLEHCPHCRAEIAAQRELLQAMRTPPAVESMPHASLQKLWSRIDGGEGAMPAPVPADAPTRRRPGVARWLAAAVVVQAVLLGVLFFALLDARGTGDASGAYRTVSSASATTGSSNAPAVRAVFAPEMPLGELQALLERAQLRIVNGPSAEGVLTLALANPRGDAAQALAILRAHPAARFAEPIGR